MSDDNGKLQPQQYWTARTGSVAGVGVEEGGVAVTGIA